MVAVEEDVDVNRAGGGLEAICGAAAKLPLDTFQGAQERQRHQFGLNFNHAVDEPPLPASARWLGLVERRPPRYFHARRFQPLQRPFDLPLAVAEV